MASSSSNPMAVTPANQPQSLSPAGSPEAAIADAQTSQPALADGAVGDPSPGAGQGGPSIDVRMVAADRVAPPAGFTASRRQSSLLPTGRSGRSSGDQSGSPALRSVSQPYLKQSGRTRSAGPPSVAGTTSSRSTSSWHHATLLSATPSTTSSIPTGHFDPAALQTLSLAEQQSFLTTHLTARIMGRVPPGQEQLVVNLLAQNSCR